MTPGQLRDRSLDALRGVGILLVVLSHVLASSTFAPSEEPFRVGVVVLLYLCNVQVLAFVSGMLIRPRPLLARVSALLVPLLAWTTLEIVLNRGGALAAAKASVKGLMTGGSQYWFLLGLFLSLLIADLIVTRAGASTRMVIAIVAGVAWPFIPAWTALRGAGLLLPFVLLGSVVRDMPAPNAGRIRRAWPLLLIGFVVLGVLVAWVLKSPVWIGYMPPPRLLPVQFGATLAGFLACIGLLGLIRSLPSGASGPAASVGRSSMGIYGFHGSLLTLLPSLATTRSPTTALLVWAGLVASSVLLTMAVSRSAPASSVLLGGRPVPRSSARRAVRADARR